MATQPCQFKLPIPLPCDWDGLLGFFELRAIPGIEAVVNQAYLRSHSLGKQGGWTVISRTSENSSPSLSIQGNGIQITKPLQSAITRVFDLDAPTPQIEPILRRIPRLPSLLPDYAGLRVPGAWSVFELGVRAILGQQVTVRAARTLAGRLVAQYGSRISQIAHEETCTHAFPSPEALLEAPLEKIGMPGKRAQALRAFSQFMHDLGDTAIDPDSFCDHLISIPGIGPWTVNYIRMRALKDRDAFPTGDIALLNAAKQLGIAQSFSELKQQAEAWRPFRAYATIALWRILSLSSKS